ncbi:MAG: sugar phosphate isomerase/epimerase family protein [Terriglobales bacterium]
MAPYSRRDFGKLAAAGLPLLAQPRSWAASHPPEQRRQPSADAPPVPGPAGGWQARMGLELYTVRDRMARDQEKTLAEVAAIGYKEVEPIDYGGLSPRQYRALLDRYGLISPSTHAFTAPGPSLQKTLAGYQIIGHRYTWIFPLHPFPKNFHFPPPPKPGHHAAMPTFHFPAATPESTKRDAEIYNRCGQIAKPFGIKILIHNHTTEFEHFPGTTRCPYDILLAETDPELVVMQLDIGWSSVAGVRAQDLFRAHPGRFVLWHVKDVMDLNYLFPQPVMNEWQRMMASGRKLVPVGQGDVDYRAIFADHAAAGMRHFCVEQDNGAQWGDSVAAARTSYHGLLGLLA